MTNPVSFVSFSSVESIRANLASGPDSFEWLGRLGWLEPRWKSLIYYRHTNTLVNAVFDYGKNHG